jgi:hypothetical protein
MVAAWKGTDTKKKEKKNCAVLERQGNFRSGWEMWENHCMRAKTIFRPSPTLRKSQSRFFQSDEIFDRNPIHAVGVMCANASVVF